MAEVIPFKTKSERFNDWVDEVLSSNELLEKSPENAMIIWYDGDTKKGMYARYNCDLDTLDYFKSCFEDLIRDLRFRQFLREHIHEFLEYIN